MPFKLLISILLMFPQTDKPWSDQLCKFKYNAQCEIKGLVPYAGNKDWPMHLHSLTSAGLGGSVGCASDWRPGGRGLDPC